MVSHNHKLTNLGATSIMGKNLVEVVKDRKEEKK